MIRWGSESARALSHSRRRSAVRELRRAGDHNGVRAWSQVAEKLSQPIDGFRPYFEKRPPAAFRGGARPRATAGGRGKADSNSNSPGRRKAPAPGKCGAGANTKASRPAGRPGADPSAPRQARCISKCTLYQRSITPQSYIWQS